MRHAAAVVLAARDSAPHAASIMSKRAKAKKKKQREESAARVAQSTIAKGGAALRWQHRKIGTAAGARFGKRVKRTRRDLTMPTPETALEIEKFSEEMQHQFLSIGKKNNKYEADRKINRSAMLAITTDDLEAARVWRGDRSLKLNSLKMVRQVFFDEETGKVGTRFFRCVCTPCMERRFSECVCKSWTLGEPIWQ